MISFIPNLLKPLLLTSLCWNLHIIDASPAPPAPARAVELSATATQTPFVTTETAGGSTYTLTYIPSTVASSTTVTEQSTTFTVDPGQVVGIIVAGAGAAALPEEISEIIPGEVLDGPPGGEPDPEDGDDDDSCTKKEAAVCERDCTLSWFVSDSKPITTSMCAKPTCTTTTGCDVTATTKIATASASASFVVATDIFDTPGPSPRSVDLHDTQIFLRKEFERLQIDSESEFAGNADVSCVNASSAGSLNVAVTKLVAGSFCAKYKDAIVAPGKGVFGTYSGVQGEPNIRLKITYLDEVEGPTSQESKLNQETCQHAFYQLITCGSDTENTFGGAVSAEHQLFELYPYRRDNECMPKDATKSGVSKEDAENDIRDFCSKYSMQEIKDGVLKSDTYKQKTGGMKTALQLGWASDKVDCGKDKPLGESYKVDELACQSAFGSLSRDCDQGGTLKDFCATYTLNVTSTETMFCFSKYPPDAVEGIKNFTRDEALDTISEFCDRNLVADPNAADPGTSFGQNNNDWPKGVARHLKNGILAEVTFPKDSYGKSWCPEDTPKQQAFETGGDECLRRFKDKLIDGCDTDSEDEKEGGYLEEAGENGCVEYKIVKYDYANNGSGDDEGSDTPTEAPQPIPQDANAAVFVIISRKDKHVARIWEGEPKDNKRDEALDICEGGGLVTWSPKEASGDVKFEDLALHSPVFYTKNARECYYNTDKVGTDRGVMSCKRGLKDDKPVQCVEAEMQGYGYPDEGCTTFVAAYCAWNDPSFG